MKKLRVLLAAALLVCIFGVTSAFAQRITVENATGFTIVRLGLADADVDGDAQDLLDTETLGNGEVLKIDITGSPKGWELVAQDKEGSQVNWQNLDLTGVKKITLHADGTAVLE